MTESAVEPEVDRVGEAGEPEVPEPRTACCTAKEGGHCGSDRVGKVPDNEQQNFKQQLSLVPRWALSCM